MLSSLLNLIVPAFLESEMFDNIMTEKPSAVTRR